MAVTAPAWRCDVARLAVFPASDEAACVSVSTFHKDGGLSH